MSEIILKAESISKQYRLGVVGSRTLSHDLNRWWSRIRHKEDPYLKIGEVNNRSEKGSSDYVWALKDINFEVNRGDVLGIIGKNGAGKSTLLKILSRVTTPTTGSIKTKGRIASLLEVGTGFHPELTGRENIYLNGAILGMTKAEITRKLDEIIAFSGCERYVDTPVKRYSSGMKVRLAFAVAAHLEPEILVVDEVLAVGDIEFQKKAIGKMQDISKGEGRTVLFVSHNMAAVKNLCTRATVLEYGRTIFEGSTDKAIEFYQNSNGLSDTSNEGEITFEEGTVGNHEVSLEKVVASGLNLKTRSNYFHDEDIIIRIYLNVYEEVKNSRIALIVKTLSDEIVFVSSSFDVTKNGLKKGKRALSVMIPKCFLNNSDYIISVSGAIPGKHYFFEQVQCFPIHIENMENKGFGYNEKWPGSVHPVLSWDIQ